jgi:hypothetical protein
VLDLLFKQFLGLVTADQKLAPQRPEISWLMQLPQCGMLIVARNGKELKLSDIIVGDEAQEELAAEVVLLEEGSAGYQVLLNKYAELPHEAIGLVVAKAFVEENDEATEFYNKMEYYKADYKKLFLDGGFYNGPSDLGRVLLHCCMLAQDAKLVAENLRDNYKASEAIEFSELSERLQHAVACCLDFYGNDLAFAIGISVEGNHAIDLACQAELNELLSSSAVVGIIRRKWRGPWLHSLLSRKRSRSVGLEPVPIWGSNPAHEQIVSHHLILTPSGSVFGPVARRPLRTCRTRSA